MVPPGRSYRAALGVDVSFDPGLMRTGEQVRPGNDRWDREAVGVAGRRSSSPGAHPLPDLRVSVATGRTAVGVAMAAPSGPVAEVASDVNQRGNGCAGVSQRTCVLYLSNGGGP